MALETLFERQMAMYVTYHRDPRNRITHFVGIPLIIFSVLLALSMVRFGDSAPIPSVGVAVALLVWVLWLSLDRIIGGAMGVFLVPAIFLSEWLATRPDTAGVWWLAGLCFVGGWAFQLLGHVYEGRRPALVSNLFQALIGPMFLAGEILHALGFKRDLYRRVEALAAEYASRARAKG